MSDFPKNASFYDLKITVNKKRLNTVVISPHYKERHSKSINDLLILKLVKMLDNQVFDEEGRDGSSSYFKTFLILDQKKYKLIWTLEDDKFYVGVVNAHRSEQKED